MASDTDPATVASISFVDREQLSKWQRSFAPLMRVVVVALAIFFFAVSYLQFERIAGAIRPVSDGPTLAGAMERYEVRNGQSGYTLEYLKWQQSALIEERAQRSRLDRAAAALLVNFWTRYLGFVTGMVLAIAGATFIMARLDMAPSSLTAKGAGIGGSLNTSSPGIMLVVLGAALMLAAMTVRYRESGSDRSEAASGPAAEAVLETDENAADAEAVNEELPPARSAAKAAPAAPAAANME